MEKCLKKLKTKILHRDSVMERLYSLLAPGETMPDSIFIVGHTTTGKTLVVESLLEYLNYNVCYVNCVEYSTTKQLLEHIVMDLAGDSLSSHNNFKIEKKCDNFVEFFTYLRNIYEDDTPIVIVFDKCERLRNMDDKILHTFMRLRELTWMDINICSIFVSDIPFEKFKPKTGLPEPIKIHFPPYSFKETENLLMLSKPDGYDDSFYRNYLNLYLSVYFRYCRDLNELRYMAHKNFAKYIEPIESGKIKKSDTSSLWKNIGNTFAENLEVLYLRVSSEDFEGKGELAEIESTTKLALSFELPYYAKYLLIAAYLASYNPPKEDKNLFVKLSDKRKKTVSRSKKRVILNIHSGPRIFPYNRMLAIFCSIIDEKVDLNVILLTQLPTMCELGLITVIDENNLDEPKYKCCVGYEFISVISKLLDFEVKKYLSDFMH